MNNDQREQYFGACPPGRIEPVIKHYGKLGMRWGVRHDPEKAYKKASKKLNKLASKYEKYQTKANKKRFKADKAKYGLLKSQSRAARREKRAGKLQYKANKAAIKAAKWYKTMDSTFAKKGINLTENDIAVGKSFVNKLQKTRM